MANTKPSTPFGKFFNSIGIWHPKLEDAIKDVYNHLHADEQKAVKDASGLIAIVNANLNKVPDEVFTLIQQKFPDISKDTLTDMLNKLNGKLIQADQAVPADFATALGKLQDYLGKHQGNTWIAITRAVVSVLTDLFLGGGSPIQKIESVLEYVYQNFIKAKVA